MQTRFTTAFKLTTPIALAPMALATGGALSATCARAGALGLLGGGYGELSWLQTEHSLAIQHLQEDEDALARLGCGFIHGNWTRIRAHWTGCLISHTSPLH